MGENAVARDERENRLDRFLVQQLKAHEAQEVKLLAFHCNVKICFVNRNKYGLRRCRNSVSPVCVYSFISSAVCYLIFVILTSLTSLLCIALQEARREDQLVKRLTRQTQQEQRLAAQLLQIRGQKEVIWENRLFREQQHQQRRERDLQEALEKEAVR